MILQGKVALVTGGASESSNRDRIRCCWSQSCLLGHTQCSEETADLIRETGAECLFVKSDVSSEADVRELVQKRSQPTANSIVPLTMLELMLNRCMNNRSRILTRSCRSTRAFLCMKYEIQQITQGAGAIVNNSSTNGLLRFRDLSYVASKHAVMGLTRSAALDAKQGIRINAVNPGPIATDLMARSADQMGITFDDLGSMVPMGRIGQATEIAQAVVFSALMLLATLRDNP